MVLGNGGSVYFLVHPGDMVRVAACMIMATMKVDERKDLTDKEAVKVLTDKAKEREEQKNGGRSFLP